MSSRRVLFDLSLFRQGLTLGIDFGARSLGEMTRLAEFLEHIVYERGSLRATSDGHVEFTLLNPPLRMGAFGSLRLWWNRESIDPGVCSVFPNELTEPRLFAAVDRERPVVLRPGLRQRFRFLPPVPPTPDPHHVRLELQSVAIPPLVWFEFSDRMAAAASPE